MRVIETDKESAFYLENQEIIKGEISHVIRSLKRQPWQGYAYSSPHKGLIKKIEAQVKYPVFVSHVYRIWQFLKEEYPELKGYYRLAMGIYLSHGEEIVEAHSYWWYHKYWLKQRRGIRPNSHLPREKALEEQIARGFIHINDFVGYDESYGHVVSNINKNYLYPANFPHAFADYNNKQRNPLKLPDLYRAQYLYGVVGFTKADPCKYHKTIK